MGVSKKQEKERQTKRGRNCPMKKQINKKKYKDRQRQTTQTERQTQKHSFKHKSSKFHKTGAV